MGIGHFLRLRARTLLGEALLMFITGILSVRGYCKITRETTVAHLSTRGLWCVRRAASPRFARQMNDAKGPRVCPQRRRPRSLSLSWIAVLESM